VTYLEIHHHQLVLDMLELCTRLEDQCDDA
jgi:hypothetical protein